MTLPHPDRILRFLTRLQTRHHIQTASALIGGAILSLLGPLLLTLFCLLFSLELIGRYGFWGTYCIVAAVSLPIFFLIAYSLRGSVLERMVPDGDTLSGRFAQRRIIPILIIVEIANIGPRLVLWALDRIRGHFRVSGTEPQRMAQAVADLLKSDTGISPAKLLLADESPELLEPLLAYLLFYEIVDVSRRGDRVWLISSVREKILAAE